MDRKFISMILLVLMFSGIGFSASIGTVPGTIDLGQVEPGETVERDLYLTVTDLPQDNVVIEPSVSSTARVELSDEEPGNSAISEEDFSDWVEFENLGFNASTTREVRLPGGSVNADGNLSMIISIPQDAEPGRHYGNIKLNPQIETGDSAGTVNWGETLPNLYFEVEGEARRDVSVQDVRAFRLGEDQAAVEVLLVNRGTVTTTADSFEVDILDSGRNQETTVTANGATLAPGESQWVDASWSSGNPIEEGSYQLDGQIDYFTGQATASGSFSLPDFEVVEVRPEDSPGSDQDQQRDPVPMWLVFMVLAVLAVLMWSFDIEPFWILAITGGLTISAFILLSGVSNYLLMVLLMAVGIVFYGVM